MFAKFEVRRVDLAATRKILENGIGLCPKTTLFRGYIDLEIEVSFKPLLPSFEPL
jgi:crooked neck